MVTIVDITTRDVRFPVRCNGYVFAYISTAND